MRIADEIALEFSKIIKYAVDKEYEVAPGDTFWGIAQKFDGVSVEDIKKANPGVDPSKLQEGQTIVIPEGKTKPVESTTQEDDLGLIQTEPGTIQSTEHLEKAIEEAANAQGIPLHIFRGLVAAESSGNPQAAANSTNPAQGALGLTQLSPYAREKLGITNPYDIKQNLAGGAKWLKGALKEARRLKGLDRPSDEELWVYALMIYHAGMKDVQKWVNAGKPATGFGHVGTRTINYPKQVLSRGKDPQAFSVFWSKE